MNQLVGRTSPPAGPARPRPVSSFEYVQSVLNRLRIAKDEMTYSEMAQATGIHSTLLCRYVTGTVRPSRAQAELLEKTLLRKSSFRERLRQRMTLAPNGYLDLHDVTTDPRSLRWIASEVAPAFSRIHLDRVLTAASSGIPLATAIALEIQVPLAYATREKSYGAVEYLEADLAASTNPSEVSTLYVPSNMLRKNDSILIVDDVATSGRTMSSLISLVRKAGGEVSGVFVLVSRSHLWRQRIAGLLNGNAKISVLFDIGR